MTTTNPMMIPIAMHENFDENTGFNAVIRTFFWILRIPYCIATLIGAFAFYITVNSLNKIIKMPDWDLEYFIFSFIGAGVIYAFITII